MPPTTTQPGAIDVDRVSVSFDLPDGTTKLAVDEISVSIPANQFICVMGPSGCGKTTLLNMIAGLVAPSGGSVRVGGKTVSGPGADRAVVFQGDAVFPWMSVEKNIGYPLAMAGRAKADIAASTAKWISLVGLTGSETAWPRQLSGGMRKRVDLARGYAAGSPVLLLDEPFGALDIMTKEYLQEELRALWIQEPRTIFFVTHDLEEAIFLGDRILLLSPTPGRLHRDYAVPLGPERTSELRVSDAFIEIRRDLRGTVETISEGVYR